MGGFAERSAPAVFETAFAFDEAVEVLDLSSSAVPFFPGGSAEGNVLVGVEFFDGDGDGAFAAVFVVDGGDVGCFALGSFAADAGFGVGFDSAVALRAAESDVAVLVTFTDGGPSVFGPFCVPFVPFFAGQVFGWDQEAFGCPLYEEGAAVEQQCLFLFPVSYYDYLDFLLVGVLVVHDHVDTHLVEGPDEIFSVDSVAFVGDDFFEVGEVFEGGEDSVESVESVVVLGGNGSAVGNIFRWEHPEGQGPRVSVPDGTPGADDDVSVVAGEPPGGGFVGGGAVPAPSVAVGASDQPVSLVEGADLAGVFRFLFFADFFLDAVIAGNSPAGHG